LLRNREPQPNGGTYTRQNVHLRDNKLVSDVKVHAPLAPYLSAQSPYGSRNFKASASVSVSEDHQFQTLSRRGFFSSIGNAFKKVGHAISSGVKAVGHGIASAARKVGSGIGHVARTVGHGVKSAVKAVGNGVRAAGRWVKENGAKIAKAGLKIASTVGSVAGRVANVIPGVGKVISKALKYASAGLDKASDSIHANLGSFGKAMSVMDRIQHPLGTGIGGQVLDAVLKRDVGEGVLHN